MERRVDDGARSEYLTSLSARRSVAVSANAAFWAFEHMVEAGRFLEFVEGKKLPAVEILEQRAA